MTSYGEVLTVLTIYFDGEGAEAISGLPTCLEKLLLHLLEGFGLFQDLPTFSVKDRLINILGFMGLMVSAAATHLCHCCIEVVTENM